MSLSPQQNNYYLKAMGITAWRERKVVLPQFCVNVGGKACLLVAQFEGEEIQSQQTLWENIKNSLCFLECCDDYVQADYALVFGNTISDHISAHEKDVTYSLTQLLEKPRLKAEVWDVIKNKIIGVNRFS